MAGPALSRHAAGGNVNDSPYSRILEDIDEKARGLQSDEIAVHPGDENVDAEADFDDEDESEDGEEVESEHDDQDGDEQENEGNQADDASQVDEGGALRTPGETSNDASSKQHTSRDVDLAQIHKQQAWLRGGGSRAEAASGRAGTSDASDTASTRSRSKRKTQQPGWLEALLLPKTCAANSRTTPSRSSASVRPHVRRASTTDLTKSALSPNPAASPARTSRSDARAKPKEPKREPKRSPVASASTKSSSPASPSQTLKVECVSCLDEVPKQRSALLECKHRMCNACLKRIFTLSTEDPQLMPPKCCTEEMIPLRHVDRLFGTTFKATWNRKYSEYTTKHRLYCPTKNCGEWIKPKYIEVDRATGRKVGKCKECKTKVCKKCGLKWHGGRECENDESTRRVIDLGKEMGWQRCYNCRAMVQLSEGCNHMRCRCNAEFCMVCAQKWKTCDCPWFNLPPELGVEGFLDPGQALPVPPLGLRIGNLPYHPPPPPPPPPPGYDNNWNNRAYLPPPPPPPPIPFRDRRDMPLDPLNPGDIFRPADLDRTRSRRRRTMPALPLSSEEQQAADEVLARELQEQELAGSGSMTATDEARDRRRAIRRARRAIYAITDDDARYRLGDDVDGRPLRPVN